MARKAKSPTISLIILTYNGKALTDGCLASVKRQKQMPFETIVIDNGSIDGTAEMVRKKYGFAKLIRCKENLGFAGGNNVGMRRAKGEYVFLLNNDTRLDPDCIQNVAAALKRNADERIGMWATKLVYFDTDKVDAIGISINRLGLAGEVKDENDLSRMIGPSGGACILSRTCLDDIAENGEYYDSRLFIYNEDTDLAWRASKKGWKTGYIPVSIHHHHSATTTDGKTKQIKGHFLYLSLRNRVVVFLKDGEWIPVYIIPFLVLQAGIWFKYVLKGRGTLAFNAITDGLRGRFLPPKEIFKRYA